MQKGLCRKRCPVVIQKTTVLSSERRNFESYSLRPAHKCQPRRRKDICFLRDRDHFSPLSVYVRFLVRTARRLLNQLDVTGRLFSGMNRQKKVIHGVAGRIRKFAGLSPESFKMTFVRENSRRVVRARRRTVGRSVGTSVPLHGCKQPD